MPKRFAPKGALTASKSSAEGTAEVFFEVADDFFLDAAFQQGEKKPQFRLYPDFVFTHRDHAVYTGSFKMNDILVPAVIDAEFPGEVTRKFVCRLLGMRMVHFVVGANINPGHKFQSIGSERGQFRPAGADKPMNPHIAPALNALQCSFWSAGLSFAEENISSRR
jgi:hypothetical protein